MRFQTKPGKSEAMVDWGRKLRQLRKSRSLTQTDLAGRIGVQQSDLCRMENGQYRVTLETLMRVLSELEASFSEFFPELSTGELSAQEMALLRRYRQLAREKREEIDRYLRFLAEEPAHATTGENH